MTRNSIETLHSPFLERALRAASRWHRDQRRKGSDIPYISHPVGVALILARLGFPEAVIAAGLLHDVVEDTEATAIEIEEIFGVDVAAIVATCTETKADASGADRPWADRKRDYLEQVASGSIEARAVALADKLHNLASIRFDLESGNDVWRLFHADREAVLSYYQECVERFEAGESRLCALGSACRDALSAVSGSAPQNRRGGGVTR